MLDERDFEDLLKETLQMIADKVEMYDEDDILQVDYLDGVLNITSENDKEFTLKGDYNRQRIILLSTLDNNSYFEYIEDDEEWIDVDDNSLLDVLKDELLECYDINVRF